MANFEGKLDHEVVKEFAKEIARVVSEHDCKRFLNDNSKVELDLSVIEIYELPGFLDTAGMDRSWKRALIVPGLSKDYIFFETVANNYGYTVKLFTDKESAISWLKEGKGN
ncbi:MAG: hypothetical protein JW788_05580 [Candidatus Omnitrophica bacterium]|nr:hypothetical protein [Candidatus Omnitrophota bacterium]